MRGPFFLVACAAMTTLAVAQGRNDDVAGWQQAKWGMTPQQVKVALGAQVLEVPEGLVPLKSWTIGDKRLRGLLYIPNFSVANADGLEVVFGFDEPAHLLRRVGIDKTGKHSKVETNAILGLFGTLETMLMGKYGAPTKSQDSAELLSRVWSKPRTSIYLSLERIGDDFGSVGLTYTDQAFGESDKL
jgi:hypothetical protein